MLRCTSGLPGQTKECFINGPPANSSLTLRRSDCCFCILVIFLPILVLSIVISDLFVLFCLSRHPNNEPVLVGPLCLFVETANVSCIVNLNSCCIIYIYMFVYDLLF
ncbi:hypothetical protein Cni_G27489 [Canna indica]|uniref:Uncharacterized protein n=1 Tax=Canna indica TaxID=4628 RepID=A0AAQ3L7X0_9LILI|nr:hypothetical protein Cni_G27489 [Canna indica]